MLVALVAGLINCKNNENEETIVDLVSSFSFAYE